MCKRMRRSLGLFFASVIIFTPKFLLANPLGGVVAQGAAAINPLGNVLTISQTSSRAVINN